MKQAAILVIAILLDALRVRGGDLIFRTVPAQITVTNLATGVSAPTTASGQGTYLVVDLAPGRYRVEGEAAGFEKYTNTVVLQTGQRARLEIKLGLGAMSEIVDVQAAAPLIDSQSAVRGTVIEQNEISKLPLAIRNWDDMLALVAGVQRHSLHARQSAVQRSVHRQCSGRLPSRLRGARGAVERARARQRLSSPTR